MSQTETVLSLINARQQRHALGRELYTSDAVFQQDLQHIWYKSWIFIGHDFEIPSAGEYLTVQIGQYPIVVVRNKDNSIRAFHNSCRHRGSRLCAEEKGKLAKLVCPYHSWTYELNGDLLFAPNMGDSFDATQYNLKPAHCEVSNSYIYVCVGEQAPDFAPFQQTLAHFMDPHDLAGCKVAHESTIIEEGNWKLVFENNRECYHCDRNHPELLCSFQENLAVAGIANVDDPELDAFIEKCEQAGLPSRLVIDEQGQYRMTRIPLFGSSVSYTLDGKPAVKNLRLDKSGVENIGALLYFNYPSTWNHILGDFALSFRILPLAAGKTAVTTKWLVPKDAQEGVDYDLEHLTRVWLATNDQDKRLVEESFIGVTSPTYQPGPFSDTAENGVCQFVDWYCDRMKMALSDCK